MANVIVTDDVDQIHRRICEVLGSYGHLTFSAVGDTMRQIIDAITAFVDTVESYILVLDFNLRHGPVDGEVWGGIWLYVALRDRGLLAKCKRVLVCSRYIHQDLRSLNSATRSTDAFIARVFVELEQIPDEDIFKLDVGEAFDELAKRVTALGGVQAVSECRYCGQPIA